MTVRTKRFKNIVLFLLITFLVSGFSVNINAEPLFTNEDNGYDVYIEDDAELLMNYQEEKLLEIMKDITKYGGVALKTVDENPEYSTESLAKKFYREKFGTSSGVVFVIDMDNRYLYIFSDGEIYKTITKSYAEIITDNVYEYASDKEYYECCEKAFSQMLALLEGRKIAQPMKYISNFLIATLLALIINYFIVMAVSKANKPSDEKLLQYMNHSLQVSNLAVEFSHQTRVYSPQESSSGGGGGGGGGGSSGGGGGHSF